MSDFLPIRDELARKSIQAIEDLSLRHVVGDITADELWIALGAVIDTVLGLVPEEVASLLNQARNELRATRGERAAEVRVFVKDHTITVLSRRFGGATVRVAQIGPEGIKRVQKDFAAEDNPTAAAQRQFDTFARNLGGHEHKEVDL